MPKSRDLAAGLGLAPREHLSGCPVVKGGLRNPMLAAQVGGFISASCSAMNCSSVDRCFIIRPSSMGRTLVNHETPVAEASWKENIELLDETRQREVVTLLPSISEV